MKTPARSLFLFIFLICAAALGYALYLQQAKHLLPCPLCVVQRVAYWLIGLTAVAAFVHNPAALGRRVYGALLALWAVAGAVVASRHAWLLRHPDSFDCGVSAEERFLNALPIAKWWPAMFEANGDCALVKWRFMTLTIPDWSLILFLTIGVIAIYVLVSPRGPR